MLSARHKNLNIPVVAVADTNCDPDGIDFLIPGNDDAIRSIRLISSQIAEAILRGQAERDGDNASEEAMSAAVNDTGVAFMEEATTDAE